MEAQGPPDAAPNIGGTRPSSRDSAANTCASSLEDLFVDPIVEEIRKIRDEHAARFNYDIDAIFEDMKRLQNESGIQVVSLPPKRISRSGKPGEALPAALNKAS